MINKIAGTLLAVEPHDGTDSFVNAALDAARSLQLPSNHIAVDPRTLDGVWGSVLAHGSVLRDFAYYAARNGVRTVLTDCPADPPALAKLHLVEWGWHEGMGELADAALELDTGQIVLLTGPSDLPPQWKIYQEVAARCALVGEDKRLKYLALDSFSGVESAQDTAKLLLESSNGPGAVITSAGSYGEAVAACVREHGWRSYGLGRSAKGHVAKAVSDVEGVVRYLLQALEEEAPLPKVIDCGFESGFLRIEN